jgi:hypothetical protein
LPFISTRLSLAFRRQEGGVAFRWRPGTSSTCWMLGRGSSSLVLLYRPSTEVGLLLGRIYGDFTPTPAPIPSTILRVSSLMMMGPSEVAIRRSQAQRHIDNGLFDTSGRRSNVHLSHSESRSVLCRLQRLPAFKHASTPPSRHHPPTTDSHAHEAQMCIR